VTQKPLRIQKILAHLGYASRRTIEDWIRQGKIKLNDKFAKLGDRVDLKRDRLSIDNKRVSLPTTLLAQPRLILYHKPIGEICSHVDPKRRRTIFDTLPKLEKGRWIYIGRLDFNTSGLLLLTNNGDIAHRLMHPSQFIEREYAVRVLGKLTPIAIKNLTQGVMLQDGDARVEHILEKQSRGVNHWYQVVVMEGRNRLVRRLFESQGFRVNRLIRVRFGHIILPQNLKPGQYQELPITDKNIQAHLI
jgi:23S rRNA pseudouridine2605 synthase